MGEVSVSTFLGSQFAGFRQFNIHLQSFLRQAYELVGDIWSSHDFSGRKANY